MDNRSKRIDSRRGQCWIENHICQIPLQNGSVATCDEDRLREVNQYNWFLKKCGKYIKAFVGDNQRDLSLHRFLYPEIPIIDHINGNKLDNRACNLREATSMQNSHNQGQKLCNTVGFKGVFKEGNKFKAQVCFKYKLHYAGLHKTKEEAARAYDAKAKELHGEFARLNFPETDTGDLGW